MTVPTSTTSGQTFARFRWSTSTDIAPNTAVSDGEVEDYHIPSITQATVDLTAAKSVEVYDPLNQGLYMIPGNEVLYRITVTSGATSTVEAQDIDLSDTLPDNVRFISATTTVLPAVLLAPLLSPRPILTALEGPASFVFLAQHCP